MQVVIFGAAKNLSNLVGLRWGARYKGDKGLNCYVAWLSYLSSFFLPTLPSSE